MVRVKICGITTINDAMTAAEAGAEALGFVFYEASPRNVSPEQAKEIIRQLPPFVQTVGLFVNESLSRVNSLADTCGLDIVQLHGDEQPDFCNGVTRRVIKALRIKDISDLKSIASYQVSTFLLDAWSSSAPGGTGERFNWDIAAEASKNHKIILAGGLTPDNIIEAVKQTRPYAVDVSSGVESAPGKKDPDKVLSFIRNSKSVIIQ